MEYEFDKEIDSLLRQARPETFVSEQHNAHVDADEISLFAENALTQKARMRVTEHLADCTKCRKILSNVVALNAEADSEIVHAKEPEIVISESKIPWYRRLFVFPQLAYTMGGLTVLLAGMIGYVTLQSYNEAKTSSIAQMERSVERPRGTTGADSDGDTVTTETYSANTASNAPAVSSAASNSVAASSASNTAVKSGAPVSSANSNAAVLPKKEQPAIVQSAPPPITSNNLTEKEQIAESKTAETENNYSADSLARAGSQPNYQQNATRNQAAITPDSRNAQSRQIENLPVQERRMQTLPMMRAPNPAPAAPASENDDAPKDRAVKKAQPGKTKSAGGRNFIYKDNVWYDAAYKQQPTVNVRRNSDDYKKLDAGLRSIADNLGGTVVVVWNGKAYRIQ